MKSCIFRNAQGSMLGPLLSVYNLYKQFAWSGRSVCRLFADDYKLFPNIKSEADLKELQEDIGKKNSK